MQILCSDRFTFALFAPVKSVLVRSHFPAINFSASSRFVCISVHPLAKAFGVRGCSFPSLSVPTRSNFHVSRFMLHVRT